MSLKRIGANVALGLGLLIMTTAAVGQDLRGLQLFDTPELSTFGGGQRPNEGFFISYDGLWWHLSPPKTTLVGAPGTRQVFYGIHPLNDQDNENDSAIQSSSLDTSGLSGQGSSWTGGQRIELGRIANQRGWLLSFTELQTQITHSENQNVNMVLNDPDIDQQGHSSLQGIVGTIPNPDPTQPPINIVKNLPITFTTFGLTNSTQYWSIELMYALRSHEIGDGGYLECYAGPRYVEYNDNFLATGFGGNLDTTIWDTNAQNHIVAGQVGARFFKKVGRWMFNTEGRFFGGVNYQSLHQNGTIGSNLAPPGGQFAPLTLGPVAFSHADFLNEFTPGVELRLEMRYQVTRAISLRGGWSGTWMANIARGADLTDYTLPNFGIITANNRQDVFINGAVVGVDVNH